jgi:hypothetical protein
VGSAFSWSSDRPEARASVEPRSTQNGQPDERRGLERGERLQALVDGARLRERGLEADVGAEHVRVVRGDDERVEELPEARGGAVVDAGDVLGRVAAGDAG